jgi:hypothetical protein
MTIEIGEGGNHCVIRVDGKVKARWKRCGHLSCVKRKGGAEQCCRCQSLTKKLCHFCLKNP